MQDAGIMREIAFQVDITFHIFLGDFGTFFPFGPSPTFFQRVSGPRVKVPGPEPADPVVAHVWEG